MPTVRQGIFLSQSRSNTAKLYLARDASIVIEARPWAGIKLQAVPPRDGLFWLIRARIGYRSDRHAVLLTGIGQTSRDADATGGLPCAENFA
jgi:hypothetical protein